MAYVANLKEDEEKKQGQAGANLVGGEQTSSGQSSVISGSGESMPQGESQAAQTSKAGSGSGWTNLSQYTDANRGNDAAMATDLRQTQGEYINQARDASQSLLNTSKSEASQAQLTGWDDISKNLTSNPSSVSKDEFDKYYNYQYQGPKDVAGVSGFQQTDDQFKNLGELSQRSNDFSGVASLLNETYGQGDKRYNRGQNTLDTFITRQGDQGSKALSDFRSDIAKEQGAYNQNLGLAQQYLTQQSQAAGQKAGAFQDTTQSALANYLAEVDAAKKAAGGSMSAGIFAQTGTPQGILSGQDQLEQYITQGSERDAQLRALSQLMGTDYQATDWDAVRQAEIDQTQAEADQMIANYGQNVANEQKSFQQQQIERVAAEVIAGERENYFDLPPAVKEEIARQMNIEGSDQVANASWATYEVPEEFKRKQSTGPIIREITG